MTLRNSESCLSSSHGRTEGSLHSLHPSSLKIYASKQVFMLPPLALADYIVHNCISFLFRCSLLQVGIIFFILLFSMLVTLNIENAYNILLYSAYRA